MIKKENEIVNVLGKGRVKFNEILAPYTTFNIGGSADYFYEAKNEEEIVLAINATRKLSFPYFVLGGGANLLISDKGIRGLVIKIENLKLKIPASRAGGENLKISVGAGVTLAEVVQQAADVGLSGLEFAVGIPGSVGGAIVGNAGAWQQAIGDRITRVKVVSGNGEITWYSQKDCGFDYRESKFKIGHEVILEAELELVTGDKETIIKQMDKYLEKRSLQPKEPSAGSVFVNPKPQAAGFLIEECNLKGKIIGGAQISPLHANFIVNKGGASSTDVIELISLAKAKVKQKFDIDLTLEIRMVGEF